MICYIAFGTAQSRGEHGFLCPRAWGAGLYWYQSRGKANVKRKGTIRISLSLHTMMHFITPTGWGEMHQDVCGLMESCRLRLHLIFYSPGLIQSSGVLYCMLIFIFLLQWWPKIWSFYLHWIQLYPSIFMQWSFVNGVMLGCFFMHSTSIKYL